jgi:HlyD family secretion protein
MSPKQRNFIYLILMNFLYLFILIISWHDKWITNDKHFFTSIMELIMDKPLEHTVIKQQRFKVIAKLTLYIIGIITVFMIFRNFMTPSINRADLRTSIVERTNIEATLSAGGTVVPKFEEVISSEITAQVIDIIARPGQAVKKGESILKLDTISVKNALDSLEERIAMKENQILSKQLDSRQTLNSTQSKIELLEVDLEIKDTLFQRLTLLESSGATAKHDLLEAKLAVKRSKIEIAQLTTSLQDKKESSEAEIAGITLEKIILEKEQKEQLRLLESSTVKAPRDGILTWLQEQEGTSIVPGQPIARIADLSTFKVEATISDFYASQLFEGQEVLIRQAQSTING